MFLLFSQVQGNMFKQSRIAIFVFYAYNNDTKLNVENPQNRNYHGCAKKHLSYLQKQNVGKMNQENIVDKSLIFLSVNYLFLKGKLFEGIDFLMKVLVLAEA